MAGRYRLLEPIGVGGMGTVWRAEDVVLRRSVALKLLKEEFASDEESRTRFRVEAQAAAAVCHPNVVAVYDYGEQAERDGTCLAYVVMEYVPGRSLSDVLAERGRLDPDAVASILEQAALGLDAAHSHRVIHRDVKPGNLLLAPDGTVKITDFGIARVADAAPLTRTGTMLGTAQYISPEQASGAGATPASDFYSLGVVAYTCLAGHPPFDAPTAVATAMAHLQDPVPPLPDDVPPGLRRLVHQLLAKQPADRPASGREVSDLARQPDPLSGYRPAPPIPPGDATQVLPTPVRTRRRWPLVAVPALGAVAAVIGLSLPAGATPHVPAVSGQTLASAQAALTHDGFKTVVRTSDSARRAKGYVLAQSPQAGQALARGKTVSLTVSSGRVAVDSQSLAGQPYATVAARLKALGLVPSETTVPTTTVPPGAVVSVSPSGEVAVGSTVAVQVAATPPPAPGPGPGPHHHHGGGDH